MARAIRLGWEEAEIGRGRTRDAGEVDNHRLGRPVTGEATDVALAVQDGMRSARRDYGNIGTVHLFMAAPAGLAVLIGQLLNTFGSVLTYEHLNVDGSGQYKPAALLRPCA